jgi:hypothetical protein
MGARRDTLDQLLMLPIYLICWLYSPAGATFNTLYGQQSCISGLAGPQAWSNLPDGITSQSLSIFLAASQDLFVSETLS